MSTPRDETPNESYARIWATSDALRRERDALWLRICAGETGEVHNEYERNGVKYMAAMDAIKHHWSSR